MKPTQTQTVLNTLADISINAGCWRFIVTYETSNHRLFLALVLGFFPAQLPTISPMAALYEKVIETPGLSSISRRSNL